MSYGPEYDENSREQYASGDPAAPPVWGGRPPEAPAEPASESAAPAAPRAAADDGPVRAAAYTEPAGYGAAPAEPWSAADDG
ncbi:MAG: hypothetical protein LBC26_00490, partial [Oscillospiraceae bacterium]|nr:hypothetical protein [Oscillospiraceae bacterium]